MPEQLICLRFDFYNAAALFMHKDLHLSLSFFIFGTKVTRS
ncbi:Uncharacterized protein EbC_pEb17200540 (plasmid) [Erwinia billingiae Eb661]|uniref:Uncharacterized protein n=1 Tax=Erwinia billingiae (strain Eb661) TaxID=634500 RepID=D8MJQ9_ERWBE|nr:Uncharacterized protein EbC_pEb17200540 [Erwinia billingiae Eb661]